MLVLSRKKNDRIMIAGGRIEITVVEIRGDKVRLGIKAPKDVSINRHEIEELISAQRRKEAKAIQ